MFSVFRMGPAACGRRLCDIGRVLLRVIKRVKMGGPGTAKLIVWRLQSKTKQPSYRYILVAQGLPNFLTRDLVTLNNTRYYTVRVRWLLDHTTCRKY